MAVLISMLRGVNLGPHNRMKMEDLRGVYESLGLRDVQTYVQSGNVVFRAARPIAPARIEDAIERKFGFRPPVVLRTSGEMRDVIARNPFAGRAGIEPSKLLVWFLSADPGDDARRQALAVKAEPEEVRAHGRELYIYFPNGMARPKLSMASVERAIATSGTGRNWNTVTKLLELAATLETAPAGRRIKVE